MPNEYRVPTPEEAEALRREGAELSRELHRKMSGGYRVRLGDTVIYCAKRCAPRAAIVTEVIKDDVVHVMVFDSRGRSFPAFHVTEQPTGAAEHYWRSHGEK